MTHKIYAYEEVKEDKDPDLYEAVGDSLEHPYRKFMEKVLIDKVGLGKMANVNKASGEKRGITIEEIKL